MSEKSKGNPSTTTQNGLPSGQKPPKRTRKDSGTPFLTPRTFTRSVTKLLGQVEDPKLKPIAVNSEKPAASKRTRTPSVAVSHPPSNSGTPFLAPRTFTRSVRKLLGTAVDDDLQTDVLNPERSSVSKTRAGSEAVGSLSTTESSYAVQIEAVSPNVSVGTDFAPPPVKKRGRPRKTVQPTPASVNPPSTFTSLQSVIPSKPLNPEASAISSRKRTPSVAASPPPVIIVEEAIDIPHDSTQLQTTDKGIPSKAVELVPVSSPSNQIPTANQPGLSSLLPTSAPLQALPINQVSSEIQQSTVDLAVPDRKRTYSNANLEPSSMPEPSIVTIESPPCVKSNGNVSDVSPIARVEPDYPLIPPATVEVTTSSLIQLDVANGSDAPTLPITTPHHSLVNDTSNTISIGPENYFDDLDFEPPSKRWKHHAPPPLEDPTPVGIQITTDSQQAEVRGTASHGDLPAQPSVQHDGLDLQNEFPITSPDARMNPTQQPEYEPIPTPFSSIDEQPVANQSKQRPLITPKFGHQSNSTPSPSNQHISDELASQRWSTVIEAYKKRKSDGHSVPFDVNYPSVMPWQRIQSAPQAPRSKPLFNETASPSTPLTSHPQTGSRLAYLLLRPTSKKSPTTSPPVFKKISPPQVSLKTPIRRHPLVIQPNNRANERLNWHFTLIIFLFLFLFLVVFSLF